MDQSKLYQLRGLLGGGADMKSRQVIQLVAELKGDPVMRHLLFDRFKNSPHASERALAHEQFLILSGFNSP